MNTHTPFSIGDMLSAGWSVYKKNWLFIILAGIVTIIISFIIGIIAGFARDASGLYIIVQLISIFVSLLIGIGWAQTLISLIRGSMVSWKTFKPRSGVILTTIKVALWYILYFIGYSLLVIIPFVILALIGFFANVKALMIIGIVLGVVGSIIVNIYFKVRYQKFLIFTVLDHTGTPSKQLFHMTGKVTKGNMWQLVGFYIVMGLINLLGVIPVGLGLFITIPVTKLATAKVYDHLKLGHANSV